MSAGEWFSQARKDGVHVRGYYIPKKAWMPAVLFVAIGLAHGLLPLFRGLFDAAVWICVVVILRLGWQNLNDNPKFCRVRYWGVVKLPENVIFYGHYLPKTSWMPVVLGGLVGLYIGAGRHPHFANPMLAGMVFGILVTLPWMFVTYLLYNLWTESNDKYPLTQEEAILAAGYTNIFQVPNFYEWARVHDLRFSDLITFNYQDGNIRPGRFALDPIAARKGLPQTEGRVTMANAYLTNGSPSYHAMRLEYAVRFGDAGYLEPLPQYGIPPVPSIPK